jgi:hypothetical protein
MELMKPPRRIKVETSAAAEPPTLSDSAIEVARLVALLRGEGLTGSTLQELLQPESAAKLKGMLTDYSFPVHEERNSDSVKPANGKLLAFKAREAVKL